MLTSTWLQHYPRDVDLTWVFISRVVNKENRFWWYNGILWNLGLQGWIGGHSVKWNKPGTERTRKANISSLSVYLWILPCSNSVAFVLHCSIQIHLGWTRAQQFSLFWALFLVVHLLRSLLPLATHIFLTRLYDHLSYFLYPKFSVLSLHLSQSPSIFPQTGKSKSLFPQTLQYLTTFSLPKIYKTFSILSGIS